MTLRLPTNIKTDIVLLYGENNRNASATRRAFVNKYPEYANITLTTITRIVGKFVDSGSVLNISNPGRPRTATSFSNRFDCLIAVNRSPNHPHSLRKIGQELGISTSSVFRIMKEEKYHPYKIQIVQGLHGEDEDHRKEFCEWVLNKEEGFEKNIIFSDEAIFHLSGHVNRHNTRYWSDSNPHITFETQQFDPRVMVWCGIHDFKIIGPYFFSGTVNALSYKECLEETLIPYLENVSLRVLRNIMFQQDGAPAHYATTIREFLNEQFPGNWIGRRGPVEWPPRSPDLTPLDFFLWGYLKSKVYISKPQNLEDLKDNIKEEISKIDPNTLQKVIRNWLKRIKLCHDLNGRHIEQFD